MNTENCQVTSNNHTSQPTWVISPRLDNQTRRHGLLDRWSESVEQLTTISPLCWQSRQAKT